MPLTYIKAIAYNASWDRGAAADGCRAESDAWKGVVRMATSKKAASTAGKILRDPKSTKSEKRVASSNGTENPSKRGVQYDRNAKPA